MLWPQSRRSGPARFSEDPDQTDVSILLIEPDELQENPGEIVMSLLGEGALVIWNDVASGRDREFDRWHIKEHMPERLAVPGFLRGRRYTADSDHPRYFTLYETTSVETLGSAPYLTRLNDPSPWSRQLFPLWRNTTRAACRVTATLGQGIGGCVATVELGAEPRRDEELRGWLTELVLPRLVEHQDVVGVHLCEADAAVSQIATEEKRDRGDSDAVARWVVLVEGSAAGPVASVCREFLATELLRQRGGTAGWSGIYRLAYSLAVTNAAS